MKVEILDIIKYLRAHYIFYIPLASCGFIIGILPFPLWPAAGRKVPALQSFRFLPTFIGAPYGETLSLSLFIMGERLLSFTPRSGLIGSSFGMGLPQPHLSPWGKTPPTSPLPTGESSPNLTSPHGGEAG